MYTQSMQSKLKYLQQESSETFYTSAIMWQCLEVSKGLGNIPFHSPLHLFHLLRSELHWLCSLPAHSMFHLTFHLPNSPMHHIVVGYLLEEENVTQDWQQHACEVTQSTCYIVHNCSTWTITHPILKSGYFYCFWKKTELALVFCYQVHALNGFCINWLFQSFSVLVI